MFSFLFHVLLLGAGCAPCTYTPFYFHSLQEMDTGENWGWQPEEETLGTAIKEILFDTGDVDPEAYEQADISAAKGKDSRFSVDDATWFTAFRRAACEYNLEKDHEEVESCHRQRRGRYQVSCNSSVKAGKVSFCCAFVIKVRTVNNSQPPVGTVKDCSLTK